MSIPTYQRPALEWDSLARAYVERTPLEAVAVETFGALAALESQTDRPAWDGRPGDYQRVQPRTIANLIDCPGYVYVGSPYTKYRDGHSAAAGDVSIVAGALMRLGLVVYVPIAHGHYVSMHDSRLPTTWEFWKKQCQPMIDAASALVVVTMDGWDESVGLAHEIACFLAARKPVIYADPDEAYDMAGGAEGLWKVAA